MSAFTTNGYIVRLLEVASVNDEDAKRYLSMFRGMEEKFFEKVHPYVDVGLAIRETQTAKRRLPNIFTVHGSRHISDLIKSLDKLVEAIHNSGTTILSPLEAYILLCAAHVHDTANVVKREDHPSQCGETLRKFENLFVSSAEIQQIFEVASVHGGRHSLYGKDTIRPLLSSYNDARLPLLAALLRLGDELSENESRVPETVVINHPHSYISKLAHAYARSFSSFNLRGDTLFVVFGLYPEISNLFVEYRRKKKYFLEYLEDKINIIEQEVRYCSQYGRPYLNISNISVVIRLFKTAPPSQVGVEIKFDLPLLHGYPNTGASLCTRSPDLHNESVSSLMEFIESKS